MPFDIVAKPHVLDLHVPKLQQGYDGLVSSFADSPYASGKEPMSLSGSRLLITRSTSVPSSASRRVRTERRIC